jgi:Tol biopolymer transport system component
MGDDHMEASRIFSALMTPTVAALLFSGDALSQVTTTEVIVYETYGYYGGPADIHIVNPDGTGDVNLTPDTDASMELDPELSPDGTAIVFISNRVTEQNPDGNFEIFTMAIDGSAVHQVTVTADPFGQGAIQSYNPTWSPDGLQIAFDGYRELYGASGIYAINVDGTGEHEVTSDADFANKWLPDWSPDGSKILFTWGWDYYYQDVRTINPDGTGEENLTPDTDGSAQGSAVWSPDGARIAYSGDGTLPGIYPNPNREIFVMEYPSLLVTQVTEHEAVDEAPAWSSDGTEITFASPRDGRYALYVVAAPPVATEGEFADSQRSIAMVEPPVRKIDPTIGEEGDPFWGSAQVSPASYALTVSKIGRGRGVVASRPSGIACGPDCSETYSASTRVTLVARASQGFVFAGWSGACSGTAQTCTVTMNQAASVRAAFVRPQP